MGGSPLRGPFGAVALVCVKRRNTSLQHMAGGIAQMATHVAIHEAFDRHVHRMANLLFGVREVFFGVGIAVHDQSPGCRLANGLPK